MGCSDSCVVMDLDGYSEFTRETTPRARKAYKCHECLAVIGAGERHQYLAGKCEGDFWDARTCAPCAEIRKAFVCDTYVIGELWEALRDQLFPDWKDWHDANTIDCIAKLTTQTAIDKVRAEYAEYREDRDL